MRRCERTGGWWLAVAMAIGAADEAAAQSAARTLEGRVTEGRVEVRLQPDLKALVIGATGFDTALEVLEERDGWVKVVLPSENGIRRTGFIPSRAVATTLTATTDMPSIPPSALAVDDVQRRMQAAIHPGYANDPAYWRQVVKVLKVLEHRHRQHFNLISPVLGDELANFDSVVPKRTKDRQADIDEYRRIAAEIMTRIDASGPQVHWQPTLSAVEPEKGMLTRLTKRVTVIAIYGVNPLAGEAYRTIAQ